MGLGARWEWYKGTEAKNEVEMEMESSKFVVSSGQSQGRGSRWHQAVEPCPPTTVPISPLSLSHLHPHTHTIITLLIQGKERLMLSAGTGHHKLFFLNRTKKHFPPTVASSPLSSLLSSSLMQSHGLCNYKAVL